MLLYPFLTKGQLEAKYQPRADEPVPLWVQKMYEKDPDPGVVMKLYDDYYRTNTFVKNQHTQYYKRWLSGFGKIVTPDSEYDAQYLEKYLLQKQQRAPANWTPIGPFDWDHNAAGRSYAPGSAHVYTVEQSLSNHDVLYAGTANAGVWKSVNHGLNWTSLTNNFLTGSVTAIEIDPSSANIVYAELLSSIYKSVDGGTTWTPTGSVPFQSIQMA